MHAVSRPGVIQHNPYATSMDLSQEYISAPPSQSQSFAEAPHWQQPTSTATPFGASTNSTHSSHTGHVAYDDLLQYEGTIVEHARTASGSSFLQSALLETCDSRSVQFIWMEVAPVLAELLLDVHGCYVVKSLIDRLPQHDVRYVLDSIANADALGFNMCTHSLHTRRVVQHIIENFDGCFLCDVMTRHCKEVALTQQGCIVLQRSMDHAYGLPRELLFTAVYANLSVFAHDPYGNYVVQHLLEIGDREKTSECLWSTLKGNVVKMSCNKFASNVVEKCLFHVTAEVQHQLLVEMYSAGSDTLYEMLQDSFGNYIIQSSIALATCRDVAFVDKMLRPVLQHTPYGHKIESKLDRRLKGKPVSARATGGAPRRGSNNRSFRAEPACIPEGEAPW